MSAGLVVMIPSGGGETQTLPYTKECLELFALTGDGDAKTLGMSACTWV